MSSNLTPLLLTSLHPMQATPAEPHSTLRPARLHRCSSLARLWLGYLGPQRPLLSGRVSQECHKLQWEEDIKSIPDSDQVELRKALVPEPRGATAFCAGRQDHPRPGRTQQHEMEQFEPGLLEYIRLDLALPVPAPR
ncbi:hypothetical protein FIBSPDRAFT_357351 [Athelia psychrophila]|uniref:Uncharacterized protein n=1 Tax=Athelia psychrophila TaxID=1759441 RepID=A0A166PIJ5_9AGAM|nr:hypothetical protein FIBSPDRAFT_357351 [Fibularhizoctonia sp. CBS 109695]